MSVDAKAIVFHEKIASAARDAGVVIFSDRIWIYDPESGDSTTMEIRAQPRRSHEPERA